jgi:hypothetical protein
MKRSLALFIALSVWLSACAPAATQAPAQKPAQPQATSAPAAAQPAPAQATIISLATALPELKPPPSGGVLNPPTLIPTLRNSAVTSGQQPPAWATYRDPVSGLTFQYPRTWQIASSRNLRGIVNSLIVAQPNQPITNTTSILIDVRKKQGDLLTWLGQQLPIGSLLIDGKALETGSNATTYNARVGNNQAVFMYAPAHGKTADIAALHTGDNQYFYQITYLGGTPDNADDRAAFLHVLNTLTLTGTTSSGVTLPTTAFTNRVDTSKWK